MQRHLFTIAAFAKTHRRSAAWAGGALALLAFFLYVVVPFIASTRIVKERIAFEMSMWSGYNVTIGEDTRVKLFPFRAVLTNVQMAAWRGDAAPVLSADEVILNLSPFAALIGDIYFYKVRLEGFTLRVHPTGTGLYVPRPPGSGRMANAVKDARVLAAGAADLEDASSLASEPFGRLHFTRGRVVDEEGGGEIVTQLDGVLAWQRLDKSASLAATGIWHGETVAVNAEAAEPVALLAQGASQASLSVSGTPGGMTFDGTMNVSQQPYLAGHASFSTASLRRMLEWSGANIGASPMEGAVKAESRVQGTPDRIKFEDLQLTFGEHAGSGMIEVLLDQKRPAISGTLALERLDLDALLSAVGAISIDPADRQSDVERTLPDRFDLDLRVSATRATTGIVNLADVAATAQIRDGLAVFDISDARAFGGTVQAGLRLDRSEDGAEVETSLRATEIDGGALGQAFGLSRMIPAARGNVSVLLKGPVKRWDTFTDRLSGGFSAEFGRGTLPGFDLAAFVEKMRGGGIFPLADVAAGTLAIDRLQLKGSLSHNVAHVERAEMQSGRTTIELSGVVSFPGRAVALTGALLAVSANSPGLAFFVGGSWSEPFISPAAPATNLN